MAQLRYKGDGPDPGPSTGRRFYFALLLAIAGMLLIFGKADNRLVDLLRSGLQDLGSAALRLLAPPIQAVNQTVGGVQDIIFIYDENARLREENARLRRWVEIARRLEAENQRLTALEHVKTDIAAPMLTARAIADSGGPFVRAEILNAGSLDGLRKGQVVVDENGVVGRTVAVGRYSARVLLLTDLNSRVPVLVEGSNVRAILVGDNSDQPMLRYLPSDARAQPGDRILTSGEGGVFPPLLPVGRIASVEGTAPRVRLFSDFRRLDYLRVLDYNVENRFDVKLPPPPAPPTVTEPQPEQPKPAPAEPAPTPPDQQPQPEPAPDQGQPDAAVPPPGAAAPNAPAAGSSSGQTAPPETDDQQAQ